MAITKDSIEWAIDFLVDHSDGDLFPRILELQAISEQKVDFINQVENKPLNQLAPMPCRRFIVPKDELSYRQATQLHPQDSIILSAIMHQFGQGIEDRRLDKSKVYSYRFLPTKDHGLYEEKAAWNEFWTEAHDKSKSYNAVLYCDIADFYNQIYHHTVENQLMSSNFSNQAVKWVISLLESTTAGVSRGVPIGPHGIHLIAESTLIPVDNSLEANGLVFQRYADDILIFCESKKSAKKALSLLAGILDKQQRLMLQKHKTKIYAPSDFQSLCAEMIEDRPISKEEEKLLGIIKRYTGGNPYKTISYSQIQPTDWANFSSTVVSKIIQDYLSKSDVDYIRLRWFYRRLTQVGHPGALDLSISEFESLGPCLANICTYISSIQSISPTDWKTVGDKLLELLETDEIQQSEFFRLSILSLFTKNDHINHFSSLATKFQSSDPFARREILLAATRNHAFDWLREHKEGYTHMDPWQKIAFIYAVSGLPQDEKKYFINRCSFNGPFEETLAKWSKKI
ncbi:Retron-type reverse transcriptase [Vibrio cholerae]|uniref:RNA-directed DNA polymerase n=1 Tax=Vibrio cholerae TaxID=666 RepID=UPI000BA9D18D|nr:RNA-directed DNA polymerase [Vibrio cholerae]EGQ9579622.1 Retron-type reverse transcriptase [Vibrio cholerae]EGR5013275.1 Retron-type reverse transcriptase [Vibrio cholerae]EJL7020184.1 Retron-type reverse transcriptase [Vibrio cholerae]EKF9412083.1 Retron-type reverse transcriptase [Vibrio cholerae]EKF9839244.1 Retron-type reverse transcriptase [Vibrio cholerae]